MPRVRRNERFRERSVRPVRCEASLGTAYWRYAGWPWCSRCAWCSLGSGCPWCTGCSCGTLGSWCPGCSETAGCQVVVSRKKEVRMLSAPSRGASRAHFEMFCKAQLQHSPQLGFLGKTLPRHSIGSWIDCRFGKPEGRCSLPT